jgi:hypothetical protein
MLTQLHIEFKEAIGWIVTGVEAGPSGTISLPFESIRLTLDAADTSRFVELAVFTQDAGAPVGTATLDACRRLLGTAVADVLAARPAGVTVITGDSVPRTPQWEQVASTARALFLSRYDAVMPRLAALRVVAHGRDLGLVGATELLREHAWEALPAVIALGRTAARNAQVVDRLPDAGRRELAGAITALEAVLTGDDWDATGRDEVSNLTDLLRTPPTDEEVEELVTGQVDIDDLAASGISTRGFAAGRAQREIAVAWYPETEDLRARLGDFAAEAFAGAIVEGALPGRVNVEVPLRLGAAAVAPSLTVRVQAWSGEVLGEAPVSIRQDPQSLPVASARVNVVAVPPGQKDPGVYVDIALTALAPLDAAGLRSAARGLARRAGQRALLARSAGRTRAEAESWSYCAQMYTIGDDGTRAATAENYARAAEQRSAIGQPDAWPDGPDWATDLIRSWRKTAHDEIIATDALSSAERISQLQLIVRDLSAGASGLSELAQACQKLSAALREYPGATVADHESAIALLREALRIRYLSGGRTGAERAARDLTGAQASATGCDE